MNKAAPVNIEHRKRAEEAPKASKSEFSLVINTIPAREWPARPDGSAAFFNQHHLAYVGLPSEQVRHSGWTVAVHPEDLGALVATWQLIRPQAGRERSKHDWAPTVKYRWFLFRAEHLREVIAKNGA